MKLKLAVAILLLFPSIANPCPRRYVCAYGWKIPERCTVNLRMLGMLPREPKVWRYCP